MIEREITLPDSRVLRFHVLAETLIYTETNQIYVLTRSYETENIIDHVILRAVIDYEVFTPELLENLEAIIQTADLAEYTGLELPNTDTVDSLKAAKKKEINDERDRLEKQGFPFMGKIIDSDLQSVVRVTTMSFAAMIAIVFTLTEMPFNWEPQEWTTADNSILIIDTPEMAVDMHSHLMVFGSELHARATDLKAQVDSITSTDLEEVRGLLDAIPIS